MYQGPPHFFVISVFKFSRHPSWKTERTDSGNCSGKGRKVFVNCSSISSCGNTRSPGHAVSRGVSGIALVFSFLFPPFFPCSFHPFLFPPRPCLSSSHLFVLLPSPLPLLLFLLPSLSPSFLCSYFPLLSSLSLH